MTKNSTLNLDLFFLAFLAFLGFNLQQAAGGTQHTAASDDDKVKRRTDLFILSLYIKCYAIISKNHNSRFLVLGVSPVTLLCMNFETTPTSIAGAWGDSRQKKKKSAEELRRCTTFRDSFHDMHLKDHVERNQNSTYSKFVSTSPHSTHEYLTSLM